MMQYHQNMFLPWTKPGTFFLVRNSPRGGEGGICGTCKYSPGCGG